MGKERGEREREEGEGRRKREEGREKEGVRNGRGRERVFKGNCDQERESVHQKANEWKSNGLAWMDAMSSSLRDFKGPYSSFVPQVNH